VTTAFKNAGCGKVSANPERFWRVVSPLTRTLTVSLTVACLPCKKPFIHAGFIDLQTEGNEGNEVQKEGGRNPEIPPFFFVSPSFPLLASVEKSGKTACERGTG